VFSPRATPSGLYVKNLLKEQVLEKMLGMNGRQQALGETPSAAGASHWPFSSY